MVMVMPTNEPGSTSAPQEKPIKHKTYIRCGLKQFPSGWFNDFDSLTNINY